MHAAVSDADVPETRWARSGDLSIAYQVFGDGPIDLLVAPGFVSHCEVFWGSREVAAAFRRLAESARVIIFDKREQGLSDRVGRPPVVEEMVDDALAVMDAAGSERAAIFGISEGGALAQLLAAGHPDRCTHLMLWSSFARLPAADDYPEGIDPAELDNWREILRDQWGGPVSLGVFAPSRKGDQEAERWWAQLLRQGTSPGSAFELMNLYKELDVRAALESIQAPTLVMHRRGDRGVPAPLGRYIADNIAGARYVEFEGADHLFWTQGADEIIGEMEEFLTGARRAQPADRVLATVMFTDIVDSTAVAARLGDRAWRELLDRHDERVVAEVERGRGTIVKTTGDGVLATFDGPARGIETAARLARRLPDLGVRIRAGLHTGECERRGDDVGGMAVHIGARIGARAEPGEVLVSSTVKDLVVGSGIEFADRGSAELKGVPGEWRLFAVAEPPA
jgi:pimeloyl-ACP methyl ester carboxylesterase